MALVHQTFCRLGILYWGTKDKQDLAAELGWYLPNEQGSHFRFASQVVVELRDVRQTEVSRDDTGHLAYFPAGQLEQLLCPDSDWNFPGLIQGLQLVLPSVPWYSPGAHIPQGVFPVAD
jgi:hypothetical protein